MSFAVFMQACEISSNLRNSTDLEARFHTLSWHCLKFDKIVDFPQNSSMGFTGLIYGVYLLHCLIVSIYNLTVYRTSVSECESATGKNNIISVNN